MSAIDTIWKFSIPVNDQLTHVNMPVGAVIVHVGCQNNLGYDVQFWVTMGFGAEREFREFLVVGTGQKIPDEEGYGWVHRGTTLAHGGRFVWHLMERVKERVEK